MDMAIFRFPEEEIKRYRRHGIARAYFSEGCTIDLEPLLEIAQPKCYWMKQASKLQITVASPNATDISKAAVNLDSDRQLESLTLRMWHLHPTKPYSDFEIEPVYKN